MSYKYIIHLADIHIRTGNKESSRYEEYLEVFKNLELSIKEKIKEINGEKNTIICVAGDIFHHKNKIENYGLKLFNIFINILRGLLPTFIIPGNHDYLQQDSSAPGLLDATIFDLENVYLLKKTENMIFGDIGITTIAVDDTLKNGESFGINNNLPSFPLQFKKSVKSIIGLFHGSFGKTKLNETRIADEQNSYPLDMLNNLDIAILGDIHLRQTGVHNNCNYGYSGSLIQQNYGETIIDHGYILWNIETKESEYINVYNNYGSVYVIEIDEKWMIKYRGLYKNIEEIIKNSNFPKKIKVRVESKNSNINNLIELFKENNIIFELENSNIKLDNINDKVNINTPEYDLNDIKYFINYINNDIVKLSNSEKDEICEKIKNPELFLINIDEIPNSFKNLVKDKNEKIEKRIDEYNKTLDTNYSKNIKLFKLIDIKFENCLCYGKDNYINFEKLKGIVLINGENGSGKSSLYEIICYAIYGKPMKSRECKGFSGDFININKKGVCFTEIRLEINNKTYKIYREYQLKKQVNQLYAIGLDIKNSKITYDNNIEIPGSKNIETWLDNNIGTVNDFLQTSMITQNLDENFLDMAPKDVRKHIDNNMNIISVSKYKELTQDVGKVYKKIIEHLDTLLNNTVNNYIKTGKEEIKEIDDNIKKLDTKIDENNNKNNKLNIDYTKFTKELLNSDIKTEIDKIILPNEKLEELEKEKIILENILNGNDIVSLSKRYSIEIKKEHEKLKEIKEPKINKEYLETIKEEIDTYTKPERVENNYNEINNIIESFEEEKNKLNNNRPNRPLIITKIDKNIKKIIVDKFKSINNCEIICSKNNNPNKLINKNFNIGDIDNIDIDKIDKDINIYIENINKLKLERELNQNKINDLNDEINDMITVTKPYIELDILEKNKTKYNRYKKDYNIKIEELKLKKIYDNINALNEELNKYDNLEYNNECKFCMKRCDVIDKELIITKLKEENEKIKNYKNIKYSKNIEKWITEYNILHDNDDNNSKMINIYKEYNIYEKNKIKIKEDIKLEREKINKINLEIENILKKKLEKTDNKELYENIVTHAHSYYNKYNNLIFEEWEEEIKTLTLEINKNKLLLEKIVKWEDYVKNKYPKIELYNKLKDEHNIYNRKIYLEKIINSYKLTNIIEKNIIKYNDYNFYKEALKYIPIHNEKELILIKNKELNNELNMLKTKYNKIIEENKLYENDIEEKNNLNNLKIKYNNLYDITKNIENIENNYHDWLYQEFIIPNIINVTNDLVNRAKHKDTIPIKLDALYDKSAIYWKICTSSSDEYISIEKSSGFQKFIIGLALKLTIPKLQSKYSKCNQLFLDEGWTSADSNNRDSIPKFLQGLLTEFNSIILVSHLDEIKDNVDYKINILKKNKNSEIIYK